jgi:hypothetical protein
MRFFCAFAFTIVLMANADASCVCRCVDGEVQPLCDSSIDLPPICTPTICSIVPPSIAPIQPSGIPPLGTSSCTSRQVLNPATNRYEWRSICN